MTTQTEAPKEVTIEASQPLTDISTAWLAGMRRVWLEGGTWASKTFSALQFLKAVAENNPEPLLISVVSETMPHLKRGAIRDYLTIMGDDLVESWWNRSDFIYHFPNGSAIEFFSADMPSKLRGGRRDILFINEANNISHDSFRELDMRTRLFTIADWNPVNEFWFHQNNLADDPGSVYLHYTYLDALDVIPRSVKDDIESYEDKDPNWWRVYGLGLIGKIEGLVYPQFEQVDELPDAPRFYGLDYGFSSDPTVLTAHVIVGDKLYSKEMFYDDSALTNGQIAMKMDLLKVRKVDPIYPDPDEPKSAEELRQLGFNVKDSVKGKGSVEYGIQKVNQFYQHWTKDSLNCIKEQRNFRYIVDKATGNLTDKTTHRWSHGLDSRRYACASHSPSQPVRRSKRSNTW